MTRFASALVACILSTTAFATPTAIPYEEDFQASTSTCDAAFVGDCPTGWQGSGANGSIEYINANGDAGLRITPGASVPNGISRQFAVSPADGHLSAQFYAWPSGGGSATLVMQTAFKNSTGRVVHTAVNTFPVDWSHSLTPFVVSEAIPATAASAEVFIGGFNASTVDTKIEFAGTYTLQGQVEGMILFWPSPIGPEGCIGNCEPNISCPPGKEPLCLCEFDFDTCEQTWVDCSCVSALDDAAQTEGALGSGLH